MRHFLTGLGILLAIALASAMAVPHFVDFGQYRSHFEARIAALTGHPVRIEGAIKLRLLPSPSLSLRQVKLGAPADGGFAFFEADRISGVLAPTPLLRGEFQVTEALIDQPILRVGAGGLESLAGKASSAATPAQVAIEKLTIRDGTAVIAREGREALTVTNYNGEIEASSLTGPAKGNGDFVAEGRKLHLRFALGKIEAGKARLKALFEDELLAVRLDVDGVAGVTATAAERFDGAITLVGNTALGAKEKVQLPLRIVTKAKLAGPVLTLRDLNVTAGPDPQPLVLAGEGTVTFTGRPVYSLTLVARSYDFDRPGPDGKPKRAVPAAMIREFMELLPNTAETPEISGKLDLSAGALIVGGQTIISPSVLVEQVGDTLRMLKLEAELPGQTRVSFARDAAVDPAVIAGTLTIDSRDPERLNGWFNGVARTTTAAASTTATATLKSVKNGVEISRIVIDRGETRLTGSGRYLLALPGARPAPQLVLKLGTERMNVSDIPSFIINPEKREEKPDLDFDVDISAQRLMLEGRDSGRLLARMRRDGTITSIERVEISANDGTGFVASGTLGGGSRRVTLKLDAAKADGIAAVAEQVFPGPFTEGLRRRADSLSPALIVATLANNEADDTYDLSAEGRLGGSDVKVNGKLIAKADIHIDMALSAANADSGRLARQFSGTRRALVSSLPGQGQFAIKGNPRAAMDVVASAQLLGVEADVRGAVRLFQPFVPFSGLISAKTGDVQPFLTALGIDAAYVPKGARGNLTGTVESNLQQITIAELKSQIGATPITGEIAFKLAEGGTIAGQLKLPFLDMRPMLALVMGPTANLMNAKGWPTEAFAKPMLPPLAGDLWIEAEGAQIDNATQAEGLRFVARFADGVFALEHGQMRLGGARLNGEAQLRRNGNLLALATRFGFAELDLEKALRGPFKGLLEGEIQAAAQGESLAKLMQAVAGTGRIALPALTIAAHDPWALTRFLGASQPGAGAGDAAAIARRLEAELGKAPLTVPEVKMPVVLIDGAMRLGPMQQPGEPVRHDLSGTYDLSRLAGDFRLQTALASAPEGWRGVVPAFVTQWRGGGGTWSRSLGVEQLVNAHLAAALQRDADLREMQEQDLRERAYFNRRLKAMEWEKRQREAAP